MSVRRFRNSAAWVFKRTHRTLGGLPPALRRFAYAVATGLAAGAVSALFSNWVVAVIVVAAFLVVFLVWLVLSEICG
jgi:hypothetical protein